MCIPYEVGKIHWDISGLLTQSSELEPVPIWKLEDEMEVVKESGTRRPASGAEMVLLGARPLQLGWARPHSPGTGTLPPRNQ